MEPTWRCEIHCDVEDGVTVLTVAGRLGSEGAGRVRTELTRLMDAGHQQVLVDLAGVDYMNSAGLRALETTAGRLREAGGTLALSAVREPVRLVLEMAGLLETVAVEETRQAAILRLRGAGT